MSKTFQASFTLPKGVSRISTRQTELERFASITVYPVTSLSLQTTVIYNTYWKPWIHLLLPSVFPFIKLLAMIKACHFDSVCVCVWQLSISTGQES